MNLQVEVGDKLVKCSVESLYGAAVVLVNFEDDGRDLKIEYPEFSFSVRCITISGMVMTCAVSKTYERKSYSFYPRNFKKK